MHPDVPLFTSVLFGLTTLLSLAFLFWAIRQSSSHRHLAVPVLIGSAIWLIVHALLALSGFYSENSGGIPPRIFLAVGPALILLLGLFVTEKGRAFVDDLPLLSLTYLHVVRIPVEIALYLLFVAGAVPELMTFAGRNFDILAGITAPLIAYLGIQKGLMGRKGLLAWNIIMLGFVLFIVINAILSAPLAFQQFAFDQPNVGIFYFPFIWLPGFVVPVVFLAHFTAIRRLIHRPIETAVPA